jgi:hypothetical protein
MMTRWRVETCCLLHLSEIYLCNCCVRRIIFYLFQWTFNCYIVCKLRKHYFLKVNCDAVRTWIITGECKLECIIFIHIQWTYCDEGDWGSHHFRTDVQRKRCVQNTLYGTRWTLTSITNNSQKSECTYSVLFEYFIRPCYQYYYLFS